MTRVLDIGVFAHNEAAGIADLIGDIGRQTVFQDPRTDLRVYVLANGCTDATVPVARDAIGALPESARARIEVIDLPQGGKSRTGHRYIHELSRPGADVLGFMDADIRLPEPGTLLGMIDELDARPELRAFTSRPVKDVDHFDMQVSPMTRMIAAGGGGLADYRNTICGQLFMLRAPAAAGSVCRRACPSRTDSSGPWS
jgi:glycosyltransferase involved in cell wall biosynthesis